MLKRASLVLLCTVGLFPNSSAHAQMQQGYATDKPDITVDRSVLQDLKGYQPPPMFGGDLVPPPTNRLNQKKQEDLPPSVEVVPPAQPSYTPQPQKTRAVAIPAPSNMTAPNAEALLNHPTQNFHVLTERNASSAITAPQPTLAPQQDMEPLDGPLLPLPGDENDPAMAHARAVKAKEMAEKKQPVPQTEKKTEKPKQGDKKNVKKDDKKKEEKQAKKDNKKEDVKKPLVTSEKPSVSKDIVKEKSVAAKPELIKPNPNAYRPKAPQTMPAIPPIQVEKNALPPLSGTSPLPKLPDPTATSETFSQPSIGERMMDAALTRQMESDEGKIKEQLADTNVKSVSKNDIKKATIKSSPKTLVFKADDMNLTDRMKSQIKMHILTDLQKNKDARIEILSFAAAESGNESTARRISLARALAVRDYLKTAKIDASRMDVRALVSAKNEQPSDKIDIVLMK